jgi:hypothetical protein
VISLVRKAVAKIDHDDPEQFGCCWQRVPGRPAAAAYRSTASTKARPNSVVLNPDQAATAAACAWNEGDGRYGCR